MSKPSIMLDAGHGGEDFGAVGPSGLREKDVALAVVLALGATLTGMGADVYYTRKSDVYVGLTDRATKANEMGVDRFLSIHCNSAKVPASGFEVFTTPGQTRSDAFATRAFLEFGAEFPTMAKRVDSTDGDVDKESNFVVLRKTVMPAILFELEFIHTPAGEAFLRDPLMTARCVTALARAVVADLSIDRVSKPASPVPALPSVKSELRRLVTELSTLAERA
jgi:N-acetylmuramoyl-L-alanine amidase